METTKALASSPRRIRHLCIRRRHGPVASGVHGIRVKRLEKGKKVSSLSSLSRKALWVYLFGGWEQSLDCHTSLVWVSKIPDTTLSAA